MKEMLKDKVFPVIAKYGHVIAGCAFVCVMMTSNSSSVLAFHETEEPAGVEKFKKFNK